MKRVISWGLLVGLLILLSADSAIVAWAAEPSAPPKSPADKPKAEVAKKSHIAVTISKDTTYITEPLRADGYPDYVAALNQRSSEGVTPENNSAVLYWKAVGPSEIEKNYREKYFQMLGVPPLPEKGDYFVELEKYVAQQGDTESEDATNPEEEAEETTKTYNQLDLAMNMKRPWSKEEFPVFAAWLAANEKPLALLIEASKRPRRYDPTIGSSVIGILLPTVMQSRDVARALSARAMLRLHEGQTEEAWQDLMACHRLARLIGQAPTLIEALVAITIDAMAYAGDQALVQHAKLTSAQIAKMRDELTKLPPLPKMVDKVNVAERFTFLDSALMIARDGFGGMNNILVGNPRQDVFTSLADAITTTMTDGDIVLRMGNSWYDREVAAFGKPTRAERMKALGEIEDDIAKLAKSTADVTSLVVAMFNNSRKAVSERTGQMCVCLFLPAIGACANAEDRWTMMTQLNDLAFALAQYRADHGAYPAKLAELVPKYVTEVPKDMFNNDSDLHYQQDGQGYLLYSFGRNEKDDGGKSEEDASKDPEGYNDWDDLVVRVPAAAPPDAPKGP